MPEQTTTSGLRYEDLEIGNGKKATGRGETVFVHYIGCLVDGSKFDSSHDRGEPLEFALGAGLVIPGWDEGIVGMRAGGRRKLIVPPELGYGARGSDDVIPPNAVLIFDIQLLDVMGKF